MNKQNFDYLIFDKDTKIHQRKEISSMTGAKKAGCPYAEE